MVGTYEHLTPAQVTAARDLLGWSRERLAAKSDVSLSFVRTYEVRGRISQPFSRAQDFDGLKAIRVALEAAGVQFVDENGGGAGVRLSSKNVASGE